MVCQWNTSGFLCTCICRSIKNCKVLFQTISINCYVIWNWIIESTMLHVFCLFCVKINIYDLGSTQDTKTPSFWGQCWQCYQDYPINDNHSLWASATSHLYNWWQNHWIYFQAVNFYCFVYSTCYHRPWNFKIQRVWFCHFWKCRCFCKSTGTKWPGNGYIIMWWKTVVLIVNLGLVTWLSTAALWCKEWLYIFLHWHMTLCRESIRPDRNWLQTFKEPMKLGDWFILVLWLYYSRRN